MYRIGRVLSELLLSIIETISSAALIKLAKAGCLAVSSTRRLRLLLVWNISKIIIEYVIVLGSVIVRVIRFFIY